jgi:coronin-1B/1C/6
MSARFIRPSKYRNVFGDVPKLEGCFQELRPQTAGEGNYIAANRKYFAVGILGGGGPLLVHPLNRPERIGAQVPVFNVHKAKVLDMDFNPFYDDLLGIASEDGTATMVRIPEEMKDNVRDPLVRLEGHQKRVGAMRFNPAAANIVATGSYDNTVKIWDVQAQAQVCSYEAFDDFIQSMAWNSTGSMLSVTAKDKKFRVFDPRATETAVEIEGFGGAKSMNTCWAENQNRLVLTGFTKNASRALRFYDARNPANMLDEIELDQSAGALIPWYDEDTCMLYITGKGDGQIRYYELDAAEEPYCHFLSEFRSATPHKGVCFAPKTAVNYMNCEVALCLRLQKEIIEPIRFVVPRKSDQFQGDIYPDTNSGKPAMTAEEWAAGESRAPEKVPIQQACEAQSAAMEFVARKSPAELERELAEANQRIRQLEAELAALRG